MSNLYGTNKDDLPTLLQRGLNCMDALCAIVLFGKADQMMSVDVFLGKKRMVSEPFILPVPPSPFP